MKRDGLILILCGQATDDEKALDKVVCALVEDLTPHKPYFAENQIDLEGFCVTGRLQCVGACLTVV